MSKSALLRRTLVTALIVAVGVLATYAALHQGASDSAAAGGPATKKLKKGLLGYWTFEDQGDRAVDSSGNNNDGVYVNSTVTPARFGRALKLSGGNDSHVSIPATESLGKFSDKITVTAWVLPAALPTDYRVVVSRQIGTLLHPDQFYLGFGPADGSIHFKWHLGTIENGTVNDGAIYTGTPVSGRWIHMAGVYNGKAMRLYVDGVKIGNRKQTGKIQVDDNPVTIGAEENGTESRIVDGEFNGQIDEVRIYNRALSGNEIKAIFEQPSS